MKEHGPIFKQYVDLRGLNKSLLAKDLGTSKQNLYQLFKSKEFQPDTIEKIEKVMQTRWVNIEQVVKGNIDSNIPALPKEDKKKVPESDNSDTIKDKYIALLEATNQHLQDQITEAGYWEQRVTELETRLNELLNNQLVSEAMAQSYQEYVIEVFWKLQGKKVSGKATLVEIQKKAFEKLATFEEQGLHIEQLS